MAGLPPLGTVGLGEGAHGRGIRGGPCVELEGVEYAGQPCPASLLRFSCACRPPRTSWAARPTGGRVR
eukprot:14213044-Alexandrium_andersonii.AAC.1